MSQLLLFNKPYGVLCQFTDPKGRPTLADYIKTPDVYAAGRLDFDSEGLLLLTADGRLQHQIAHPRNKLPKVYWVQIEGAISAEALMQLRLGVALKDGVTAPAKVREISEPDVWSRQPPIRERKSIPTCWIELTITEGRNRQVRRMTAAVGHPTLRLIRKAIGDWDLHSLSPGEHATETVSLPDEPADQAGAGSGQKARKASSRGSNRAGSRNSGKSAPGKQRAGAGAKRTSGRTGTTNRGSAKKGSRKPPGGKR